MDLGTGQSQPVRESHSILVGSVASANPQYLDDDSGKKNKFLVSRLKMQDL